RPPILDKLWLDVNWFHNISPKLSLLHYSNFFQETC
ncbi:uncharacterized protein METZ01_LOCUS191838, partial [marine metagenome]